MSNILDGIEYVIFDFGEVLIELDYPRVIHGFSEIANKNKHQINEMVVTAPLLQQFEVGSISSDEFRDGVNRLLGTSLPDDQFDAIWNSILKSLPKERMDLLDRVGSKYTTYILSNTNTIHERCFNQMIQEVTGKPSLHEFVTKCYFSHDIGFRKPNVECYEYVLQDAGIIPEKSLFLDDRLENVEGALQAGMNALHITNAPKQLTELFLK